MTFYKLHNKNYQAKWIVLRQNIYNALRKIYMGEKIGYCSKNLYVVAKFQ